MPRPVGTGPRSQYGLNTHRQPTSLSEYPIDELRPIDGHKTPWPEDVRAADIDKWGWPEEAEPDSRGETWGWPDAAADAAAPPTQPAVSTAEIAQVVQQASQLSSIEQQNLKQVNERNDEMAAIIAQLKLQEQIQFAGQTGHHSVQQQRLGPGSGKAVSVDWS